MNVWSAPSFLHCDTNTAVTTNQTHSCCSSVLQRHFHMFRPMNVHHQEVSYRIPALCMIQCSVAVDKVQQRIISVRHMAERSGVAVGRQNLALQLQ